MILSIGKLYAFDCRGVFYADNDVFGKTDRFYTSGLIYEEECAVPKDEVSSWDYKGYLLGQMMFTPSKLNQEIPRENDRPYADLFIAGMSFYKVSHNRRSGYRYYIGNIGASSGGNTQQKGAHAFFRSIKRIRTGFGDAADDPAGWDHQIVLYEPVVGVRYDSLTYYHDRRVALGYNFEFGTAFINGGLALHFQLYEIDHRVFVPNEYSWNMYFNFSVKGIIFDATLEGSRYYLNSQNMDFALTKDQINPLIRRNEIGFKWNLFRYSSFHLSFIREDPAVRYIEDPGLISKPPKDWINELTSSQRYGRMTFEHYF